MSGSFPPGGGRDPYEGDDLDGLLSGNGDPLPEGLQRVARTLDALRDAPMPAELDSEAAARAAFRKIMRPGESGSAPAWSASGTRDSRTLILPPGAADDRPILPLSAADSGPRPVPGRHRRRRAPQRERWQVKALVAAAAVVLVAGGAAALANTLFSGGGHPAAVGSSARVRSSGPASTSPGPDSVQGSGKPEVTAAPANSSGQSDNGPSSTELCREYFDFFAHPGQQSYSTVSSVLDQLSSRAGGASSVYYYCEGLLQPWAVPQGPGSSAGMSGYPIPGGFPGQQGSQKHGEQGPEPGGNGNGGNGNGNGEGHGKP
jgi:hypothetical protein